MPIPKNIFQIPPIISVDKGPDMTVHMYVISGIIQFSYQYFHLDCLVLFNNLIIIISSITILRLNKKRLFLRNYRLVLPTILKEFHHCRKGIKIKIDSLCWWLGIFCHTHSTLWVAVRIRSERFTIHIHNQTTRLTLCDKTTNFGRVEWRGGWSAIVSRSGDRYNWTLVSPVYNHPTCSWHRKICHGIHKKRWF